MATGWISTSYRGPALALAGAAGVAAVATLPQFQRTRAGVAEGLEAELPGSSSAKGWALAAAGGLAGGASGWVISSAMIGRIAQHSSLAGYARVPGAVMGAVFSAFLGAELAEPAAVAGKRAGSVFRLGFEGLQEDLFGGAPSLSGASTPGAFLEESRRRLEAMTSPAEPAPTGAEGGASAEETKGEDEQGGADRGEEVVAAIMKEDAAKMALLRRLISLRKREEALRAELRHTPAGKRGRAEQVREQISEVVRMKAEAKARCQAEHGVKLGRLLDEDVLAKGAALEAMRAQQLSMRMMLAGEDDKAAARALRRQLGALDKQKAALKRDVAKQYGLKLSRYAADVAKA
eukprot:jgi/Tetstr1/436274/TSEL_025116.t1